MPNLQISSNAEQIIAKFKLRLARSKDLTVPLTKAGALAVSAAKARFLDNDWPPNAPSTIRRKGSSRPGIDTGRGRQSITADEATATSIRVGTNLDYMKWLQEGVKSYSADGKAISATQAKARAALGKGFKSKWRQPPRPFLYFDDPLKAKIRAAFVRWLNKPLDTDV
jgi:phage gpG-like protein